MRDSLDNMAMSPWNHTILFDERPRKLCLNWHCLNYRGDDNPQLHSWRVADNLLNLSLSGFTSCKLSADLAMSWTFLLTAKAMFVFQHITILTFQQGLC